ncbi:MAG: class I SAM-dependent methyltransferase, partial [Chloroflexi bacterium]|nr:class I SAM-dependent methyltransferase [Chloroflexota bacterium]
MTAVPVERPAAVRPRAAPYLTAVGLSGVLLFTLELLSGRLVLPVFGGSPGVWTTTLCFFTTIVLAGYVYAHLVATRLSPGLGGALHLGLAVVAIALTVLAPRDVASLRNPALPEVVNVLLAQAVLAGPAAFLLATTSPLLSAWYARRGGDPWWLYAVSNAASFGGLLLYPFLLEPFLPLSMQRLLIG